MTAGTIRRLVERRRRAWAAMDTPEAVPEFRQATADLTEALREHGPVEIDGIWVRLNVDGDGPAFLYPTLFSARGSTAECLAAAMAALDLSDAMRKLRTA